MKKVFLPLLAICISGIQAQNKKEQDLEAIKSLSGCHRVTFNYKETFEYSNDSTYIASEEKHESAIELVELIKDGKDFLSLQHLLVVGKPDDPMIVKHWRQDWIYENQEFYNFEGDEKWSYEQKSKEAVKGQWTQKVYQVDDSPRYEGSATWVHVDGKHFWESTVNAPLPRREYTQRSDYNITERGNRHELVDGGWLHIQNNKKVLREEGKDTTIAEELGYNTYMKVDNKKCKPAKDWWKDNKDIWKKVRDNWSDVYDEKQDIELKTRVDGKHLWDKISKEVTHDTRKKDIRAIIDGYVKKES